MRLPRASRGFSLIETIFAIGLLAAAVTTLAELVALGVHATAAAHYRTIAAILAQRKIEQLRGEGTLVDTTLGVEHVDGSGTPVCDAGEPCEAAQFTMRWSIAPIDYAPGAVVIQVTGAHAHRNYGQVRAFAIRPRSIR